MQLQTNHLGLRICATLLSIGYGVVGGYVLAISDQAPTPQLGDRAFWMGTTFVIAAVLAVTVSWLVSDLSNIWCIPPRRTAQPRLNVNCDEPRDGHTQQGLARVGQSRVGVGTDRASPS